MHVVYHYDDERGSVSEGPQCGPWRITKEAQNAPDGLLHPSQTIMTTLNLPGGPSAWCKKRCERGAPNAAELFLHHGEHLRMSAGVIHAPDGSIKQLSLIREDARGPWPSAHWSNDTTANVTTADGLAAALLRDGAPTAATGRGSAITSDLQQRPLKMAFTDSRFATAGADDVVLLCADRVAIVAPAQLTEGAPFSYAAAWWPPADEQGATLYTIEARWDAQGALEEVQHVAFTAQETCA